MKLDCEVVRDLLPLYADDACSGRSRALVDEHLGECADCAGFLERLRRTEIEDDLHDEKALVIRHGAQRFRRRSAAVGSAVSGLITVPIVVILLISFVSELTMSWFFIVLAALCVAASLIAVPLMVPEDKLFWTFCASTASLMALLATICIYSHGNWFWVVSSAVLFGLSAVFLPFLLKARPIRRLIGNVKRLPVVLGVDALLFLNMMYTISHPNRFSGLGTLLIICLVAGIGLLVVSILRKRGIIK